MLNKFTLPILTVRYFMSVLWIFPNPFLHVNIKSYYFSIQVEKTKKEYFKPELWKFPLNLLAERFLNDYGNLLSRAAHTYLKNMCDAKGNLQKRKISS